MRQSIWTGVIPGVVLPFDEKGGIDWDSLGRHLDDLTSYEVSAVVVNADTGEGQHLSFEERDAVLRYAVKRVRNKVPVLAGLVANYTAEAVDTARRYEAIGAAGLQVFPPPAFLGRPLPPELPYEYYRTLSESTNVPLIVYQMPVATGLNFPLDVLVRLTEVERVEAVKESSLDPVCFREVVTILRSSPRPVKVLSGADSFFLESLRLQPDGAMLAVAAVGAERYTAMLAASRKGDWPAAEQISRRLETVITLLMAPPIRNFRARLKELLCAQGIIGSAFVRPPLLPVSRDEKSALLSAAAEAGFVA